VLLKGTLNGVDGENDHLLIEPRHIFTERAKQFGSCDLHSARFLITAHVFDRVAELLSVGIHRLFFSLGDLEVGQDDLEVDLSHAVDKKVVLEFFLVAEQLEHFHGLDDGQLDVCVVELVLQVLHVWQVGQRVDDLGEEVVGVDEIRVRSCEQVRWLE